MPQAMRAARRTGHFDAPTGRRDGWMDVLDTVTLEPRDEASIERDGMEQLKDALIRVAELLPSAHKQPGPFRGACETLAECFAAAVLRKGTK